VARLDALEAENNSLRQAVRVLQHRLSRTIKSACGSGVEDNMRACEAEEIKAATPLGRFLTMRDVGPGHIWSEK